MQLPDVKTQRRFGLRGGWCYDTITALDGVGVAVESRWTVAHQIDGKSWWVCKLVRVDGEWETLQQIEYERESDAWAAAIDRCRRGVEESMSLVRAVLAEQKLLPLDVDTETGESREGDGLESVTLSSGGKSVTFRKVDRARIDAMMREEGLVSA